MICGRRVSAKGKGKVYRTVVRAAMMSGLDTLATGRRQEAQLEVAELEMLRFSVGGTRMDSVRNDDSLWQRLRRESRKEKKKKKISITLWSDM